MKKHPSVLLQGTWDLFHVGHIAIIKRAKEITDHLIIGVNTDESVWKYKKSIPIIPWRDRFEMLRQCKYVDSVVAGTLAIDVEYMKAHHVFTYIVGSDWKEKKLPGTDEAIAAGIKIVYFPYTDRVSSTLIKEWIRKKS